MSDYYQDHILDHAQSPQLVGRLGQPTHQAAHTNKSCGDAMLVDLQIEDGKIIDLAWQGSGCVVSQAVASMLSETIKGMTVSQVHTLQIQDVEALLGTRLGPGRVRCGLLFLQTVKLALSE